MRIARIIEYFPPHIGGMEGHGLTLSFEQHKLGHDVEVFIGYGSNSKSDFSAKGGSTSGGKDAPKSDFRTFKAPFQFLPLYSKLRRMWFNFWAYNKVRKIHKKNPFDIVHLHGDFIESYFGGKLSKKLGISAVLTIHAGLNKKFLKPKNVEYFRNIKKIICVSEEIAIDLKKIGVPKEKIEVISSGIYLTEFSNVDENKISELKNNYRRPILISVGVLRISKGHKYLVDAYRKLKKKYSSFLSLIIIGDGSEKNNLEYGAKDINQVYFLGRQNHGRIIEYLKAADIFVLSSIDLPQDREGTPTSILEAMAAELPVVATKVGGTPYLIRDGVNGFLVNPGDPAELEQAIIKLIDNPDLAKKMGAQNREDIKQKDWSIIARRVTEAYK